MIIEDVNLHGRKCTDIAYLSDDSKEEEPFPS